MEKRVTNYSSSLIPLFSILEKSSSMNMFFLIRFSFLQFSLSLFFLIFLCMNLLMSLILLYLLFQIQLMLFVQQILLFYVVFLEEALKYLTPFLSLRLSLFLCSSSPQGQFQGVYCWPTLSWASILPADFFQYCLTGVHAIGI